MSRNGHDGWISRILSWPILKIGQVTPEDLPTKGRKVISIWVAVYVLFTGCIIYYVQNFTSALPTIAAGDWEAAANIAMGIAGWLFSGVILFWSVLSAQLGKSALDNTQSLLDVKLQHYDCFEDHVDAMGRHLSEDIDDFPTNVTLVLSTLLYGIQSREASRKRNKHQARIIERHTNAVEYFLDMLSDWVGKWERWEKETSPLEPVLRICLWDVDLHKKTFGYNNETSDDKYKKDLLNYALQLLGILERIKHLSDENYLKVEFSITRCDEVRLALARGFNSCRTAFCVVTKLDMTSLKQADVCHVGFTSENEKAFARFLRFARECMHQKELNDTNQDLKDSFKYAPHKEPKQFISHWFDLTGDQLGEAIDGKTEHDDQPRTPPVEPNTYYPGT